MGWLKAYKQPPNVQVARDSAGIIFPRSPQEAHCNLEVALSRLRLHTSYGKPMSADGPTLGSGSVPWVDCTVRTADRIDEAFTAILSPIGQAAI